jgi:hypothetical protein
MCPSQTSKDVLWVFGCIMGLRSGTTRVDQGCTVTMVEISCVLQILVLCFFAQDRGTLYF